MMLEFSSNERMTSDVFDDWDDDFQLTVLCQPNLAFYLPNENFPSCRSWCPAEKPEPPAISKLMYVNGSDAETGVAWAGDRDANRFPPML